MKIHILREANAEGVRLEDDVDETELLKTEGLTDNDHEHTTWVEYRFPGSDVIVHRSVHVTLKEGLEAVGMLKHLDVNRWAKDLVEGLEKQRSETGKPVELRGRFTPEELAALRQAINNIGSGSIEEL